jgi:hypothetical protein
LQIWTAISVVETSSKFSVRVRETNLFVRILHDRNGLWWPAKKRVLEIDLVRGAHCNSELADLANRKKAFFIVVTKCAGRCKMVQEIKGAWLDIIFCGTTGKIISSQALFIGVKERGANAQMALACIERA